MAWREEIRYPTDHDAELGRLITRYVQPPSRHLQLLHANFLSLRDAELRAFLADLSADARTISHHDLQVLLSSEWRCNLTASYLVAVAKRTGYRDDLGARLLNSHLPYGAEGYCVALASFGDQMSIEWLVHYLATWLPEAERRYDQTWALASLIVADQRLGSTRADEFLGSGGLWESWRREQDELDAIVAVLEKVIDAVSG